MNLAIFKGDPAAALDKARQKLADVESNIAALQATRSAKLVVAEDATDILAIDRSIAAERANLEIYKDKIRALAEECRKGVYAQREKDRRVTGIRALGVAEHVRQQGEAIISRLETVSLHDDLLDEAI
jgi:hypothetical protein